MIHANRVCVCAHMYFNKTSDVDLCDKTIKEQEIWFVLH